MAIIIYASETQLTPEHVPIVAKGWRVDPRKADSPQTGEKTIYIRVVVDEDAWPGPAVDKWKPMPGEVTLNAVPNSVVIKPKVASGD